MTTTEEIKIAPNSKEAEMMVLGCMLTSFNAFSIAADMLDEFDFNYIEHKLIFQAMKEAYLEGKPSDVHLVSEELKRKNKLQEVGGVAYIAALAQYVGTSALIEEYCEEVKKLSNQRKLLSLGAQIHRRALNKENPSKIILDIQNSVYQIEKGNSQTEQFNIRFLNQINKEYLLKDLPPKPMLLEYANEDGKSIGFLPKGIVAMLVGAGGVGKSHLLAQLAISISSGVPWLERFSPTVHCGKENRGNVFLGFGENNDEDIQRILYKASKKLREHQPDTLKEDPLMEASKRIAPFSFCGQQASFIEKGEPSRYYRGLKMRLIELAPKDGWSLIIFDPVSRILGADAETDNAIATQFIALLEELTLELPGNPTILFAHHVNKTAVAQGSEQNQFAARGSSALTDGVRWQCNVVKATSDDKIILKMTKSNFVKIAKEMKLQKESDGFLIHISEDNGTPSMKPTNSQKNTNLMPATKPKT